MVGDLQVLRHVCHTGDAWWVTYRFCVMFVTLVYCHDDWYWMHMHIHHTQRESKREIRGLTN